MPTTNEKFSQLPVASSAYGSADYLIGITSGSTVNRVSLAAPLALVNLSIASLLTIGADVISSPTPGQMASQLKIGGYLDDTGTVAAGSASQNSVRIDALITGNGSTVSYEKNGLFVNVSTLDPSTYGGSPVLRDLVAITGGSTIQTGNMLGRAWASVLDVVVNPGADGTICGLELTATNNGTDQPSFNTSTTKMCGQVLAFAGPLTAGVQFISGDGIGTFHRVIRVDPNAIAVGGAFLQLDGVFEIEKDGSIFTTGVLWTASGALTLANGLNSNIVIASSYARIAGPTGVFSVGGFDYPGLFDGQHLTIYNSVAFAMTLVNEDASSTATKRITTLTGGNVTLRAGTSAANFIYDGTASRWILISTN